MSGLAPDTIRQLPPQIPAFANDDIVIEFDDGSPTPHIDEHGNVTRIESPDGSVEISLVDGALGNVNPETPAGWFDNLVSRIEGGEVSRISEDLLRGISDDLNSRKEWIETYAQGIKLLGLQIELPNTQGAADGAPVEGMSKVRHPLLQEAVIRFQANARSEMLPTDGPVKIRNDNTNAGMADDKMADAFEMDMNHYLTAVATEYYPDTDRMFLKLGFGGTAFKKVYFCPLRNRPVSETVDAADLIVDNAATDLGNTKRITHKVMMRPSTVKRLQILGVYRDIPLSTPNQADADALKRAEADQQGVSLDTSNPEDRDREIYECYCELDVKGFEHKFKGRVSGLEIPYRVTIDTTSREILSIVRNYNKGEDLPNARQVFVQYIFVPGFGFYPIGLLHILGNTTNAVTAAWREMLDNGMFANFPGFLIAKSATRQNTNILRVAPGSGAQVDTAGQSIKDAVMPLPYNTSGQGALQSLSNEMIETGQRIGGTAELQVGEGKADAPVGTTLALIEQATKVMNSVHKRMHQAQSEEFRLLVECFREHPESFWQRSCKSKTPWNVQTFLAALDNCQLVPQADPNTASHTQRLMKIGALAQAAKEAPTLVNPIAVLTAVISGIGYANPEQFLATPGQMNQPTPEMMKAQSEVELNSARAQEARQGLAGGQKQEDTPVDVLEAQTRAKEVGLKAQETQVEAAEREKDRQNDTELAFMDLARTMLEHAHDIEMVEREIPQVKKEVE